MNQVLFGETPQDFKIVKSTYRPFTNLYYFADSVMSDRLTANHFEMFGPKLNSENAVIAVRYGERLDFTSIATRYVPNLNVYSADPAQCLPLYRYDKTGNRLENITNWGLNQFRTHYADESISRSDIFNYVYGVLHDPAYRKKYELNLRREFPRIPFYEDFGRWAAWGEKLLKLHLDSEMVAPYPLQRTDDRRESRLQSRDAPNVKNSKAKLKANKVAGEIVLDSQTTLSGVSAAAWDYKLGNRSALEWVLERYKERTPKDKTVAERFHSYRFADYKEEVVTLLGRVCAVSVATTEIIGEIGRTSE